MPGRPWEGNGSPTVAEQRLDELLGQGRPWGNRRAEEPVRLDVHADFHDPSQEVRGEYLTRRLVESPDEGGWLPFWRRSAQPPVIRVRDSVITGGLDLRAAELPYLLEFVRCRFEETPDLRQAQLAGLVLSHCRLPGARARNMRTTNDTVLYSCTSTGLVSLTDAQIGGSLELIDNSLHNPGYRAVHADRLSVGGALLAMRLRVSGEFRIPGAKIGGNVNLCGAVLRNRGRYAFNGNGIQISGSLRAGVDPDRGGVFSAAGVIFMPSAHLAGDLRMRDAVLEPGVRPPKRDESTHDDPVSTLILDRSEINGDAQLDQGFFSGGTIRMVSTRISGDLRMSGSTIDLSWSRSSTDSVERPLRSMHIDGAEVLGNVEAIGATLHGQLRMIDARVGGSFQLNEAALVGPRTDVLQANRIRVGSNLDCRDADITGTLQLQGVHVGANLDLRSTVLTKPAWHRHRGAYKSSLDLRAGNVGHDLVCAAGRRAFSAEGEVQLRRAVIGRQTNLWGAQLGEGSATNALNAFGLSTQELAMRPPEPPRGRILLRQAHCELLEDNATLWEATGGVDVEDFVYGNFSKPIESTDTERVRQRLEWLRTTSGTYQPGPYDQLAAVFRENGNEEHAVTVLIEKQRRRYRAVAQTVRPPLRATVRVWSLLQLITVSYGYRPGRALMWLLLFAAGGTAWFSLHELEPLNEEDDPVWNPVLYTVDQLLPIINLGHDVMWRAAGGSQWITTVLIAAGWVLATTVAAGITRSLRRER